MITSFQLNIISHFPKQPQTQFCLHTINLYQLAHECQIRILTPFFLDSTSLKVKKQVNRLRGNEIIA